MFARIPFRHSPTKKPAAFTKAGAVSTAMEAVPAGPAGPFRPVFAGLSTKTVVSNNFADLARIYENGINLCLIQRPMPPDIEAFVHAALKDCAKLEISQIIDPRRFDFDVLWPKMQAIAGYRAWLADVSLLLNAFCELFDRSEVGLRLRALDNAMCPRFHVDRVPARMICSYGGIGTEWLPEYAIDRSKLGLGGRGLPDDVSGLIVDRTAIRSMPAYAVGLMKGENWEGNENRGLVHRSLAPTAVQPGRLLLTLDML